ncbi:hypothetical protein KSP40_PGU006633 [Platanthera guangdongensis]|uniref:Uncharacterized protein n=1 Tax=Platanthera guangdongensis TaxID=2320717 RepID=A0ABR2MTW3_9ASPA
MRSSNHNTDTVQPLPVTQIASSMSVLMRLLPGGRKLPPGDSGRKQFRHPPHTPGVRQYSTRIVIRRHVSVFSKCSPESPVRGTHGNYDQARVDSFLIQLERRHAVSLAKKLTPIVMKFYKVRFFLFEFLAADFIFLAIAACKNLEALQQEKRSDIVGSIVSITLGYNAQFKVFETLEYHYDVCEAILLWEQVTKWVCRDNQLLWTLHWILRHPLAEIHHFVRRIPGIYEQIVPHVQQEIPEPD